MSSLLRQALSQATTLLRTPRPLINTNSVASAWVGSYKIRNPDKFLDRFPSPKRWHRYNELIQPPQTDPTEERRPATFHHYWSNVKYSPKKMWYVNKFVRGMNVDEAIKQCSFMKYKGGQLMARFLEEAQMLAVKEHNFEYKSKMWIEEAISTRSMIIKGVRKHARMRFGTIHYRYMHMFVKLTEGEPPVHYYKPERDGNDMLKQYYDDLRSRKILQGL